MNLRDELLAYFDADGFMSRRPSPGLGEEGNPRTETGIALMLLEQGKLIKLSEDCERYEHAMRAIEVSPGLYYKKPRTKDQCTKDDIWGDLAASKAVKSDITLDIYNHGIKTGFQYSSDGTNYPSSFIRPWDTPVIQMAANVKPPIFLLIAFCISILVDAFIRKPNDPSSKRLMRMALYVTEDKSSLVRLCAKVWHRRIDFKDVLKRFHKDDPNHPFLKLVNA